MYSQKTMSDQEAEVAKVNSDSKYKVDFDIKDGDMARELNKTYEKLDQVTKRMKKLRENFTGFTEIVTIFKDINDVVLKPLPQFIDKGVLLALKIIFSIIASFILLIVFLPLLSGFTRLPWKEVIALTLAFCGMAFVNYLRKKLGVDIAI